MVNIRTKGADAERELATELNTLINVVRMRLGMPIMDMTKPQVQRNQNQTAVGGKDLIGTFEMAIEVKRQEQLAINTWWKQCVKSAEALGEIPVLIFRQSRQKWRVVTWGHVKIGERNMQCRVEIPYEDFEVWFSMMAEEHLRKNAPKPQEEALFP